MEIYIQSCGKSLEQDYSWQKLSDDERAYKIEPPKIMEWINRYVQKDAHSVFIGRKENKLILFISNLESSKRSDYVGRKARNSILYIAKNQEEESLIRYLAASSLSDINVLISAIDKTIAFGDNESGFVVDHQKFYKILGQDLSSLGTLRTNNTCKIGKNSPELRSELANEILNNQLPQKDGVLVVVTHYQDPKLFKETKVWRGLSALITENSWQKVSQQSTPYTLIAAGMVGLLLLIAWVVFKSFELPIKSGDYIKLLEVNGSEPVFLYSEPELQKGEPKKASSNTLLLVKEQKDKWLKVEICNLQKSVKENKDRYKWISMDNFTGNKQGVIYQVLKEPINGC